MKKTFLLLLSVLFVLTVSESAAVSILFDGSSLPEDQGWLNYSNGGFDAQRPVAVTGSSGGTFHSSTDGLTFNEYMKYIGSDSFYVSLSVSIESAFHTQHDAGFTFSPIGRKYPITGEGSNAFVWTERYHGLYIDTDGIGFLDNSQSYAMDTSGFHDYSIVYEDDFIEVFIDETYSEIVNNVAIPVLSRQVVGVNWDNFLRGAIVFGDTTNELGSNSSYYIGSMEISDSLEPVPEPSSLLLLGLGSFMLRRKRKE
ncbi:MAG: PEP-CTERM sorting domain-containing protein [Desulfuromonadales bacterium]|nr:PEP-CTERM sorting domain-containing protein [Desulfuromonadales bacterium]